MVDNFIGGDNGPNILRGSILDDCINGGDGNDILFGGRGSDLLEGGNGNDILIGTEEDNALIGGNGSDFLVGGMGSDFIYGGSFSSSDTDNSHQVDTLIGGKGPDFFIMSVFGEGTEEIQPYLGSGSAFVIDFDRYEGDIIELTGPRSNYDIDNTGDDAKIFRDGDLIVTVFGTDIVETDLFFSEPITTGGPMGPPVVIGSPPPGFEPI